MNRLSRVLSVAAAASLLAACAQSSPRAGTFLPNAPLLRHASVGEAVLHSFGRGYDGAFPEAELIFVKNAFYGTTAEGGKNGTGTVFSIDAQGHEKTLHSFGNANGDGQTPAAGLVYADGALYGVTEDGGKYTHGTVFSITTSGKEKVVYSFGAQAGDGFGAAATLLFDKGVLYGTTMYGGQNATGTLFTITLGGKETLLHQFGSSGTDGVYPEAQLVDVKGTLYGTTSGGGLSQGTIFKISSNGSGYKTLCQFTGSLAGPTAIIYENGLLYGTTGGGVDYVGTFYSSTLLGKLKKLYEFLGDGGLDVTHPAGAIAYAHGFFYFTGSQGGTGGKGGVVKMSAAGKESVLYSFAVNNVKDGATPTSGILLQKNLLYGTTREGGVNPVNGAGGGTVYRLHP
ncbi:MAG TPA: choice-of-anchor tandem repeat GloVer-containing protein [Candidatus Acidoferrales bacterium]|jgi:uncharacterized repeat protein (TIGR03803 family)|nr:choice-of-anchor tandem repeat GloVer-containing protein [Candidatus Acidoferrales bacterium]